MQDVRFTEYFPAILVVFAASIVAGVLLTVAAVFTGGLFAYALADSLAGIWFAAAVLAGAVVLYLIFRWLDDRERQAEHEREISRMQAEALLREREPQPYVVEERPILVNKPITPEAPETIGGVPVAAWEYFITQLARGVSFSEKQWTGHQLPGGYEVASFDSYSHLIDPLVELGFIVDRDGERRKSGTLTTKDRDAIMRALREWERQRLLTRPDR